MSLAELMRSIREHLIGIGEELTPTEVVLAAAFLGVILETGSNIVIYEVANIENLQDYNNLIYKLSILSRTGEIPIPQRLSEKYPYRPSRVRVVMIYDTGNTAIIESDIDNDLASGIMNIYVIPFLDYVQINPSGVDPVSGLLYTLASYAFLGKIVMVLLTSSVLNIYDSFPPAKFGMVIEDIAPQLLAKLHREVAPYARVVGFSKIVKYGSNIKEYIRRRKLPLPHTLSRVERDITFKEYVTLPAIKEFININIIKVLEKNFNAIGTIMLIGPIGCGKRTLAYAIGKELGVPVYEIKTELMSSKWLGETEKLVNQTFLAANTASPAIVILKNAESYLGEESDSGETSQVFARVRALISDWAMSPRKNFLLVISVNDVSRLPESVLVDPAFGEYKIPIFPPLSVETRKSLITLFLRKLSKKYGLKYDPFDELLNEAVENVAEETWGYTVREIYDIVKTAVNITLYKGKDRIGKEELQLAKKFKVIDRYKRFETLKEAIGKIKTVGLPDEFLMEVYRFEEEVSKMLTEAFREEAIKRGKAVLAT